MMTNTEPRAVFRASREPEPGDAWRDRLETFWPAYLRWWRSRDTSGSDVTLAHAQRELARHMPELVPCYQRLVELAGGDPEVARFLTLYRPPPFVVACSQAVWLAPGRSALVRNYELGPELFEALVLSSQWTGRRVLGSSECLWGLDDGINEDGLAVSLTYGGSPATGTGFGIPLVLRYVLETCSTVLEALPKLCSIPIHMAYNVTLVDGRGDHRTVFLHPHRRPRITRRRCATNHQLPVESPDHAAATRSIERERMLEHLTRSGPSRSLSLEAFTESFLGDALYHRDWERAFGTLYTVAYDCQRGTARFRWPEEAVDLSFERFVEGAWAVEYGRSRAAGAALPEASPSNSWGWTEAWLPSMLATLRASAQPAMAQLSDRLGEALRTACAGGTTDWSALASCWDPSSPRPVFGERLQGSERRGERGVAGDAGT